MKEIYDKIECLVRPGEFDEILGYHAWRHRIPIREGFVTPGYLSDNYWDISSFPTDLTGRSVLDIGSNDGINAFHAERIGAREVLGIDLYVDRTEYKHTSGWNPTGCNLAKQALNSKVEFKSLSLYDAGQLGRKYDLVILSDVMNWLGDIPSAIKAVSSVCGEQLIIRDGLMRRREGKPFLHYVHNENMDLMYLPNFTFMEVILKQNGFRNITFKKVAVQKLFNEWVTDYPLLTSSSKVPVFQTPWSSEVIDTVHLNKHQALSKVDGRVFARRSGWVNISDVRAEIFRPRPMLRFARKVFGEDAVLWLKSKFIAKEQDDSYTITATR